MAKENLKLPQAGYFQRCMKGLVPLVQYRLERNLTWGPAGSELLLMSKQDDFRVEEVHRER